MTAAQVHYCYYWPKVVLLQAHGDAEVAVAVRCRRRYRAGARSRGRTVVVPMARGRLAVVVVFVLLRARSRFAVVHVVGFRVPLRAVVVARGGLGNGGQQGYHSYKDEFFHDCDENYVKVIKMFRFYNLSVEGTRILCKIYTIFYFFSVRR